MEPADKIYYSSEVYSICIVLYELDFFNHDLSKNQLKLLVHITALVSEMSPKRQNPQLSV